MLPEKIIATATFYVITVDFLFCAVLISAIPLCVSNQENKYKIVKAKPLVHVLLNRKFSSQLSEK